MRSVRVLVLAVAMGSLLAVGGCKKKGDPAACATSSAATSDACKTCCKEAGAAGHQWGGGDKPTCKCL